MTTRPFRDGAPFLLLIKRHFQQLGAHYVVSIYILHRNFLRILSPSCVAAPRPVGGGGGGDNTWCCPKYCTQQQQKGAANNTGAAHRTHAYFCGVAFAIDATPYNAPDRVAQTPRDASGLWKHLADARCFHSHHSDCPSPPCFAEKRLHTTGNLPQGVCYVITRVLHTDIGIRVTQSIRYVMLYLCPKMIVEVPPRFLGEIT